MARALRRMDVAMLAVLLCALAGAANATAGTVEVSFGAVEDRLVFAAGAGEANAVSVTIALDCDPEAGPCAMSADVVDLGAPLTAGGGCTSTGERSARCTLGDWGDTTWLDLSLGDLADSADIAGACYYGEWEEDLCAAIVKGGGGNDTLVGTHNLGGWQPQPNETLRGGRGQDELYGGRALDGGRGADTIRGIANEAEDESVVVYENRREPVSVTLNGVADDGEAGEYDLVLDVNGMIGGAGDDNFIDDTAASEGDYFAGGPGRDFAHLRGGGWDAARGGRGADELWGSTGSNRLYGDGGGDIVRGGDGADMVRGGGGDDSLWGGSHADNVAGETGRDAITPGPGRDAASGGDGNDTFHARDGYADRIRGGSGWDRGRIDWGRDSVASVEAFF